MLDHKGTQGTAENPDKTSVNSLASQLSPWFKFSGLNKIIILFLNRLLIICILVVVSCSGPKSNFEAVVPSPDANIHLYFNLNQSEAYYLVYYQKTILIDWSRLGLKSDGGRSLYDNLKVAGSESGSTINSDKIWDVYPGFRNTYNQIRIQLKADAGPDHDYFIVFRAFDNGIAFRYEFTEQFYAKDLKLNDFTELDLFTSENTWEVQTDSLFKEIPDTVILPATFRSYESFYVSISENFENGLVEQELFKRQAGIPEFLLLNNEIGFSELEMTENGFATPWIILKIENKQI